MKPSSWITLFFVSLILIASLGCLAPESGTGGEDDNSLEGTNNDNNTQDEPDVSSRDAASPQDDSALPDDGAPDATSSPDTPAAPCTAARPGDTFTTRDAQGVGEATQEEVCVQGYGNITTITPRYSMDVFFGDVTRQAIFAYEADFTIVDATWIAQVVDTQGNPLRHSSGAPIYAGWSEGAWAGPGEGFGFDATGSPSWTEVFGLYTGGPELTTFLTEDEAKDIYRAGFSLARLQLLTVNDTLITY